MTPNELSIARLALVPAVRKHKTITNTSTHSGIRRYVCAASASVEKGEELRIREGNERERERMKQIDRQSKR